jgi:hypothetical protein
LDEHGELPNIWRMNGFISDASLLISPMYGFWGVWW